MSPHPGAPAAVEVRRLGAPVDAIEVPRSLAWTRAELLDDASAVGLARVMAAMGDDGHGGRLFAWWMERFATTAHSERPAPALLAEEIAASAGADPSTWDLSTLPFRVTGVHHRIDLRNDAHCGELRVSLASTHPVYRPLHLLFLFALAPALDDTSPGGRVHCFATARRLARLSALDDDAFLDAARALLDETLVPDRFLLAESVEFTVAPWEWRQWVKAANPDPGTAAALPFVVENPPLFQTIDIPEVNAPGPKRDAFLVWVAANVDALVARTALVPESFRAPSFRLNDGVPWIPLDLGGLDAAILDENPSLRGELEIIGCPACHTADADFVQTREDRTFSPFYTAELEARRAHLDALHRGVEHRPPFGPLQPSPVLP